jgi:hypothetical protein
MGRFVLEHHVALSWRCSVEVFEYETHDEVQRNAVLEAEFTTVNPWSQVITDTLTGERWGRTSSSEWGPLAEPVAMDDRLLA